MTDIAEPPVEAVMPRNLRDDLRDFIGPNAETYLRSYDRTIGGRKGFAGFSLMAMLIPIPWLMYRKMYVAAAILLFAALIIGQLLPGNGASIGMAAAFGGVAKTLYLDHAKRKIRKIDSRDLPVAARTDLIRRAGGVSWFGAAIGTIIMLGIVAAIIAARGQHA